MLGLGAAGKREIRLKTKEEIQLYWKQIGDTTMWCCLVSRWHFSQRRTSPYTTFWSHIFWGMTLTARFSAARGFWDYRKFLCRITLLCFLQIVALPERYVTSVLEIFPHTWPYVNGFLMVSAPRIAKPRKLQVHSQMIPAAVQQMCCNLCGC